MSFYCLSRYLKTEIIVRNRDAGGSHLQIQQLSSTSYFVKTKQGIDRKSSSKRSCNIRQSSGKIEAAVIISVTSVYLLISKENQLKTQTNII